MSAPLPHHFPVRVYYEDTDAGGVVYYANYLKYLERARSELLRACGFDQTALAAQQGVMFMVRSVAVDYRKPARLDDLLQVCSTLDKIGHASLALRQVVKRGEHTLVEAHVTLACVGVKSLKPAPLPPQVRSGLSVQFSRERT